MPAIERYETLRGTVTESLRAAPVAVPIGVDHAARVVRGYVVAQAGAFKTLRGEFTADSLSAIARIMNSVAGGVPCCWGHQADPGASSTLDAFIGMAKNARVIGTKVRADLHISPVAFVPDIAGASRGERLMLRAESEPTSFGSSLVLRADKKFRLDARGSRATDRAGNVLPPVWMPTMISGSDIVSVGDAVHAGFLEGNETVEELRRRWEAKKAALGLHTDDELIRIRHRNRLRKLELYR